MSDSLIILLIFIFLSSREKSRDNKEFRREVQNLVVNQESRPATSNPADLHVLHITDGFF